MSEISTKAEKLKAEMRIIEHVITEKKNLLAIFEKAKNAYISDLKIEMLSSKSGFILEE